MRRPADKKHGYETLPVVAGLGKGKAKGSKLFLLKQPTAKKENNAILSGFRYLKYQENE